MDSLDVTQILLIGFSTGFGSALGVEFAKTLFEKLRGVKIVKEVLKNGKN